jgi:quinolinate synthase
VLDKEINEIKSMLGAIIVAHNYQLPEVQKIADFVGDSLELARKVVDVDAGYIVLAGVDFMAETAAILNPSKTVLIPSKIATCEMAQYLDVETMRKYSRLHPKAKTVLYVNSTAECKALADVVCTSANAIKVVESINAEEILFGPDANLANYVARNTNKKVIPLPTKGHCYVHTNFDSKRILKLKKMYGGIIMAHPECVEEVQKVADVVTSTVVTECDMNYRLKTLYPDREFIPANDKAICLGMKQITAQSILESLKYKRYEVHVKKEVAEKARRAIERMLELDDDHV